VARKKKKIFIDDVTKEIAVSFVQIEGLIDGPPQRTENVNTIVNKNKRTS